MNKLLDNNKIRFIISLLVSVILWGAMSFSPNEEMTVTISDIPITVELPEQAVAENLQVFSGGEVTVSVEVTGNRMTIGSLTKSDIQVYPTQTNTITSPGKYSLALSARKVGIKTDYEISTVSPAVVNIFVDRNSKLELPIDNNLRYQVPDGYYSSVSLSAEKVELEGPETELDQIQTVAVDGEFPADVTDTTTLENIPLTFYDRYGNEISSNDIVIDVPSVSATLLVLAEKSLPIELKAPEDAPPGMDISAYVTKMEPESILVAGPKETIDTLDSLQLNFRNFSTGIKNGIYNMDIPIQIPSNCRNLSNINDVSVTIDLSTMSYTDFTITKFNVTGLPDSYVSEVTTQSLTVRIYGPQKQLSALTADSVTANIAIDSRMYGIGSMEIPVTVEFDSSADMCWTVDSYTANVTISAAQS